MMSRWSSRIKNIFLRFRSRPRPRLPRAKDVLDTLEGGGTEYDQTYSRRSRLVK